MAHSSPVVLEAPPSRSWLGPTGQARRQFLMVTEQGQPWSSRMCRGGYFHGLAITDPGPGTSALGSLRTGIEVLNDRLGMARGFTIENDDISNIDSNPVAPSGASYENYSKVAGGIEFTCDPENGFSCSSGHGFDGILIAHNKITDVSREGMFIFGAVPTQNLVIRSNVMRDIGGDGIVADDSVRALIEKNVVNRFNVAGAEANGIWAYDSTGDIFEFNDVSHGEHGSLLTGWPTTLMVRTRIFSFSTISAARIRADLS